MQTKDRGIESRLSRKTTTRELRDIFITYLPGLGDNSFYWNFTSYLVFPGSRDSDGNIIVDKETVRDLAGIPEKIWFGARGLLESYSKDVVKLDIDYDDYNHEEGLARVIRKVYWPEPIEKAIIEEKARMIQRTGQVYFHTGLAVTPKRIKEHREFDKQYALEQMALAGCVEAKELLVYMNSLDSNKFTRMLCNLEDAYAVAMSLEKGVERQLDILREICIQPQPFYAPSEKMRTVRISSSNESILRLHRKVRAVFTRGLVSLDLKSSQLAIAAALWDIPVIQDMLASNIDIWNHLWEALHCPADLQTLKDTVLKKTVYSIMFGMSRENLIKGTKNFKGLDKLLEPYGFNGEFFLNIPIMQIILKARQKAYSRITKNKGARDVYGKWIPVTKETSVNSVSAQIMQSMELYLMYPIVQLAQITNDFTILLWLHDGCYIDIRDKSRLERRLKQIKELVYNRAREQGIITRIDIRLIREH
jgi:hypothetical protein